MTQVLKFAKVRDVKTPTRGTEGSAGIDFYVPNDFNTVVLQNYGEDVLIPSGIKANIPKGKALVAFNKSGVATKLGLSVGAQVVDCDYQGEIHLHLKYTSPNIESNGTCCGEVQPVRIKPGMKIVQFLLLDVDHQPVVVVEEADLYETETERGTGGFGSTGVE